MDDINIFMAYKDDEIYERLGYEYFVIEAAAKKYSSSEISSEYTRRKKAISAKLSEAIYAWA